MEGLISRQRRRNRFRISRKIFNDRQNPFECSDSDFFKRYRFTKEIANYLIDELKEDLVRSTNRGKSIPPFLIVLVSLNILGSASFQYSAGQVGLHNLLQPTVSRILAQFLTAVCRRTRNYITFPKSETEVLAVKTRFYEKYGFPNVIGAIDGTQIQIQKPALWDSYTFMNRKSVYALNVQAVCNADYLFTDLVCRWPGSTHDSHIYKSSGLYDYLYSAFFPPLTFLLGDNGYPLDAVLLTPVLNPSTEAEKIYNLHHKKTRKIIEKSFGILKSRFRIIHASGGNLLYRVDKCVQIITTCFVLHNIATLKRLPLPPGDISEPSEPDEQISETAEIDIRGADVRQLMIEYFINN